jgi:hypothetical protein
VKQREVYFKRALSLRHGKLILTAQAVLAIISMYVFFRTIPWLASSNIQGIGKHEAPNPVPPEWARAYSVNHGTFSYYPESRADNPMRVGLYVGLNALFMVPSMVLAAWVRRGGSGKERTEQASGGNGGQRP